MRLRLRLRLRLHTDYAAVRRLLLRSVTLRVFRLVSLWLEPTAAADRSVQRTHVERDG